MARLRATYRPTLTSTYRASRRRPAADQPVERRQHRPERHLDLQRRHHAGAAVGRRQLRVPVQQQQAGHVEHLFANFNPTFNANFARDAHAAAAARLPDRRHAAAAARHGDQPRHLRDPAARHHRARRVANVRNAYWELVFALQARRRRARLAGPGREAGGGQPGARRGRHDGAARRRAVARPRRPRGGRRWRRPRPRWRTAELSLKRLIVSGTDDPLWRAHDHADRSARVPRPSRSTSKARSARRSTSRTDLAAGAQDHRQQRRHAEVPAATRRLPALDLIGQLRRAGPRRHAVHPQGGLGSSRSSSTMPGGYCGRAGAR